MSLGKQVKDYAVKILWGGKFVPQGLFEVSEYFRNNSAIIFDYHKTENGLMAVSKNFRYGSIVTHGKDAEELDKNIKDAILTSFEVPSSYRKEAAIKKVVTENKYALT